MTREPYFDKLVQTVRHYSHRLKFVNVADNQFL